MSQGQPQRPTEPVKYGDVFDVSGQLASQPIAPQDAATLQAAENAVFGQTLKEGPTAVMQSAAGFNERRGVVGHEDMTDVVGDRGASIAVAEVGGHRVITESIGGQVVGQYGQPVDTKAVVPQPPSAMERDAKISQLIRVMPRQYRRQKSGRQG